MASALHNLSAYDENNIPNGDSFKFTIIVSEWNRDITNAMYEDCVKTLLKHGVLKENIKGHLVPGTYELPVAAKWALSKANLDAVICIGCVIKGETMHDEYICHAVAQGLQELSLEQQTPCIFGVITTNNLQQAIDRSGGIHGNKGTEAAVTALRMVDLKKTMLSSGQKIGF